MVSIGRWYLLFDGTRPGWVNAFKTNKDMGDLAMGEPRRTDSWRRTRGRPLIHYRFDVPALFARGLARNSGVARPGFEGLIEGEVAHVAEASQNSPSTRGSVGSRSPP